MDSEESHNGGFIVLVTGYFTVEDNKRKFAQTFFLVPKEEGGYAAVNDLFRFIEEDASTAVQPTAPEPPVDDDVSKPDGGGPAEQKKKKKKKNRAKEFTRGGSERHIFWPLT